MSYHIIAFFCVTVFALVHIFAEKTDMLGKKARSRLLSTGGGFAIAYVFIDLLPKLAKSDLQITEVLKQFVPFLERHAYIMALCGFLLFYLVDKSTSITKTNASYILSLSSYCLFNFLIGYAVVDQNDPEVQPLLLFSIAIALHYFTIDFGLRKDHKEMYNAVSKWILIGCLYLGWLTGELFTLSKVAISLVGAFIGGGVIMNVTRHELPKTNPHSKESFIIATVVYTVILLAKG